MIEVIDSNFEEIVLKAELPVVVDFWAPWCGPCRMLTPVVEEIGNENEGKYLVVKCNVDDCSEVPMNYGIRNIPTLLFFRGGELKDKLVGAVTKAAILEKLAAI